jgi:hypothetical protein
MEGVTILNEIPFSGIPVGLPILATIIVVLIAAIVLAVKYLYDQDLRVSSIVIATLLLIIFQTIIGAIAYNIINGCHLFETYATDTRTKYEIMIDDSVSFNDLYEVYDIVDVRGKILVVKEKIREDG